MAKVFLFMCFFSSVANSEGAPPVLKVESRLPLTLAVFDRGVSYDLSLPADFMREIEGVYDEVHIEDLNGDGVGEVVFSLTGENVNSCSRVLYYERRDRSLAELLFKQGRVCNIKVRSGYILSCYKEGAVWVEDVYVINGGKADIKISDRCVGCGEVSRTEYRSDGSTLQFLVSDDVVFEKRIVLSAMVVSFQANIFSLPAIAQSTKQYLIEGDKVTLLGFQSVCGEEWVKFRFSGKTTIEGWLKCSDLDVCDGI